MSNPAEGFSGGLLIEVFFGCMLYGVSALQTFIYFQKYKQDPILLKLFVGLIWLLDTVHTAFCMQFVYYYLVERFGDFEYFRYINWGIGVTVMIECALSTLVQAFYVRRVWIITNRSKYLTAVLATLVICRLALGIGSTVLSYNVPDLSVFRSQVMSLAFVSGGLGAAALVDVLVALILSFYLMRGRGDYQQASNSTVNLIIWYAVNTGAITGTASVLSVILYATQKRSLAFLGLVEIQGKLYANSFLGSLNARSHIRNKNNPFKYPAMDSFNSQFRAAPPQVPKVEVYQQTIVTDDLGMNIADDDLDNLNFSSRRRSDSEYEYSMKKMKSSELV